MCVCRHINRQAARIIARRAKGRPVQVAPSWVLDSLKTKRLAPSVSHPPIHVQVANKENINNEYHNDKTAIDRPVLGMSRVVKRRKMNTDTTGSTTLATTKSRPYTSNIFRGCFFAGNRVAPSDGCVDFRMTQVMRLVADNGGRPVEDKLLPALEADKRAGRQRRQCFVVFWGGYSKTHIAMYPLLSSIRSKDLCDIIPVSPVWLLSCITEKRICPPNEYPLLFEPQSWTIQKLPNTLRVAVTGFVRSERAGIIHVLRSAGVAFTENLTPSNTHLVCKDSTGAKFEKAMEWGVSTVSADWLYHCMQHGYQKGKETDFQMSVGH